MAQENKEKKLSQEEVRLANSAKKLLHQMSTSTKNFKMFGETHPFLRDNITNIHEILKDILTTKESVTLTFAEGSCLIEDIPLKGLDPKSYSILDTAKECGITSLTFLHGLADPDLHALLKMISGGSNALKQEGGLSAFLQRKNISSIKGDEIFFKKVSKKEEEAREAKKHLEDFLLMNYLLGQSAISRDDIQSLVGETRDPKRLGKVLSRVAGSGNMDFAFGGIEKIATHIKNAGGMTHEDVKARIGKLVMSLDPAVRAEVLKSKIPIADISGNIIEDIVKEFSDEAITELIVSDIVDRKASVTQVRKLIARLLPTAAKRKRVFAYLEEKLLKKGIPQKACLELLSEPFWQEMTSDEKTKTIMDEKPLFMIEIGIADEIEPLIEVLLDEKKFSAINKVMDRALQNFQSNDGSLKLRLVRDIGKLCVLLFEDKEFPYTENLLTKIENEYHRAGDEDLKRHFSKLFAHFIKFCVENGWHRYLPSLVKTAGYDAIKADLFPDKKLDELFRKMIFDDRLPKAVAQEIAMTIGDDAAAALKGILASIPQDDDFESFKKRYTIIRILKKMGKE